MTDVMRESDSFNNIKTGYIIYPYDYNNVRRKRKLNIIHVVCFVNLIEFDVLSIYIRFLISCFGGIFVGLHMSHTVSSFFTRNNVGNISVECNEQWLPQNYKVLSNIMLKQRSSLENTPKQNFLHKHVCNTEISSELC